MKLLYGTGNEAKLSAMRSRLGEVGIELLGLNELKAEGRSLPLIREDGATPLENARKKALAYYEAFRMPVFSCDSGLYFLGSCRKGCDRSEMLQGNIEDLLCEVPEEIQPGVHVRNVGGKCLSDEEMVEYYAGLAQKYGELVAEYRNAICLCMDEEHIYGSMDPSLYSERFVITDRPHSAVRKAGFPLDSISIDMKTNAYYYDREEEELEQLAVEDGFLQFFKRVLHL